MHKMSEALTTQGVIGDRECYMLVTSRDDQRTSRMLRRRAIGGVSFAFTDELKYVITSEYYDRPVERTTALSASKHLARQHVASRLSRIGYHTPWKREDRETDLDLFPLDPPWHTEQVKRAIKKLGWHTAAPDLDWADAKEELYDMLHRLYPNAVDLYGVANT